MEGRKETEPMKSVSEAKRLFTEYVRNNEPEISSDWTDLDGAELFFTENGEPVFDVDCILNDDEEGCPSILTPTSASAARTKHGLRSLCRPS